MVVGVFVTAIAATSDPVIIKIKPIAGSPPCNSVRWPQASVPAPGTAWVGLDHTTDNGKHWYRFSLDRSARRLLGVSTTANLKDDWQTYSDDELYRVVMFSPTTGIWSPQAIPNGVDDAGEPLAATNPGLWATEDSGGTWRRIYPTGALGIVAVPGDEAVLELLGREGHSFIYDIKKTAPYSGPIPRCNEPLRGRTETMFFLSQRQGWRLSTDGMISRTIDGGCRWMTISRISGGTAGRTLYFLDQDNGWVAGGVESASLLHTTDGARTWKNLGVQVDTKHIGTGLFFVTPEKGWMVDQFFGTMWRTTNGGVRWEVVLRADLAEGFPSAPNGAIFDAGEALRIREISCSE